jgi:hypothetical protein
VGGNINEDDHVFGLTAAKKYGGIYVPPHQAVIHQYAREMLAVCGGMILGSDSHTRYGALGTMAVGEGGGELAKQLVGRTYDMERPKVVWNEKTQRFVMLFHLELKGKGYEAARVGFAVSERATGPFRFIRSTRLHAGRWPFDMTEKDIKAAKQTNAAAWHKWWTPKWRREVEKVCISGATGRADR